MLHALLLSQRTQCIQFALRNRRLMRAKRQHMFVDAKMNIEGPEY